MCPPSSVNWCQNPVAKPFQGSSVASFPVTNVLMFPRSSASKFQERSA